MLPIGGRLVNDNVTHWATIFWWGEQVDYLRAQLEQCERRIAVLLRVSTVFARNERALWLLHYVLSERSVNKPFYLCSHRATGVLGWVHPEMDRAGLVATIPGPEVGKDDPRIAYTIT